MGAGVKSRRLLFLPGCQSMTRDAAKRLGNILGVFALEMVIGILVVLWVGYTCCQPSLLPWNPAARRTTQKAARKRTAPVEAPPRRAHFWPATGSPGESLRTPIGRRGVGGDDPHTPHGRRLLLHHLEEELSEGRRRQPFLGYGVVVSSSESTPVTPRRPSSPFDADVLRRGFAACDTPPLV